MQDDYELPSDIDAERYLLASMMQSREAIAAAAEYLDPGDFYRAAHQVMFRAMVFMFAADERTDPVTLRAWITGDGDMKVFGQQGAVYIAELYGLPANPISAVHYARLVRAAALRRRGIEQALKFRQALMIESNDPDEILSRYDAQLEAARQIAAPQQLAVLDYAAVTERVHKEHAPVVPGLIGEQDRVVVVAEEGVGKTTLAHQVAFCAAAGIHPFQWGTRTIPKRVLIADFENPALELGSRFSKLGEAAARYPGWDEGNVRFYLRMGGINLLRAQDAFEFMDAIRRFEPHLVVAGPIYKMITGIKQSDDGLRAHAAVAAFFDKVRERYGSAVWLEAHAPYGSGGHQRELRPEGWNGWAKWPEFGLALHKATKAHGGDQGAVEVRRFRGDRIASRPWPSWMTRNLMFPSSGFPWTGCWAKGVLDTPLDLRAEDNGYEDKRYGD
jgi:replicative DNA helicase